MSPLTIVSWSCELSKQKMESLPTFTFPWGNFHTTAPATPYPEQSHSNLMVLSVAKYCFIKLQSGNIDGLCGLSHSCSDTSCSPGALSTSSGSSQKAQMQVMTSYKLVSQGEIWYILSLIPSQSSNHYSLRLGVIGYFKVKEQRNKTNKRKKVNSQNYTCLIF